MYSTIINLNNVNKYLWEDVTPVPKVKVKKYKGVGRNAPCPCGSGKKYKKCCIDEVEEK